MPAPGAPWTARLRFDPLPPLLAAQNPAIPYFARRDLLGEDPGPVSDLWRLPGAVRILRKQHPDGSWRALPPDQTSPRDGLVETWRTLRFLVGEYGFTRQDPRAERACEFLFTCQTEEGDFRGFLANQYATYYTGALMALLIQAGYQDDPRIERGFRWLLAMRQDDGGWTIPLLTHHLDWQTQCRLTSQPAEPLQPDRSRPFSHNWTGMVLRAFAAHPAYRRSPEARTAAELLVSRFFQPDVYPSYQAASYWVRFQYPFWWNNLVAALDTVSRLGIPADEPHVRHALDWLAAHQEETGTWRLTYVKAESPTKPKDREMELWVTLAICRVLRRWEPS